MKEFDEGCAPFKISPIFDPVILTKVNARRRFKNLFVFFKRCAPSLVVKIGMDILTSRNWSAV